MQEKLGRIYIIRNTLNNMVYIGQTIGTISSRFSQHTRASVVNGYNDKLHLAIRELGAENFYIECLEDNIPAYDLSQKEKEYITLYDSYFNGYNSNLGGSNIALDHKQIIKEYKKGASSCDLAYKYNTTKTTIIRILKKNNVELRNTKLITLNDNKFIRLWHCIDLTISDLAKVFEVSERTIRRHADKLNLSTRGA